MKIAVIGTGYVGLTQGAGLAAATEHFVVCADVDRVKVERLNAGVMPFHEPGVEDLVRQGVQAGRLSFTADPCAAVQEADVVFLAVGTPPAADGSADLSFLFAAAGSIAPALKPYVVVVVKSTVPVGTTEQVERIIKAGMTAPFAVAMNPEFLREGSAVTDFLDPDRVVIGARDAAAAVRLRDLYRPICGDEKIVATSIRAAELTKYAANAFLAMRISFINELALLADQLDVDIDEVREGIGRDQRIGKAFLRPGCGYGGSCFPKDLPALVAQGQAVGVDLSIVRAAHQRNRRQKTLLVERVHQHFAAVKGKVIAVWGLAFKPHTDDVRESPALRIIDELIRSGAEVRVYDPEAKEGLRALAEKYGHRVRCFFDAIGAVTDADALAIVTEWPEFAEVPLADLRAAMRGRAIFDGRNMLDPATVKAAGFHYEGIGRR